MTPESEKSIQNAVLRAYATRPDMRLWRSSTGAAQIDNRFVRFGVPGQADLTGILLNGRRLEIETKSATGRQSVDQKNYERMIVRFGGVYILARSVADVDAVLMPLLEPHP
jgi:hypothetical protein